eukprot:gene6760-10925_t
MIKIVILFALTCFASANIPAASCSTAPLYSLDALEIQQTTSDGCEDKIVCQLNCLALNNTIFTNYNFTPFLDLTLFYSQNNVTRETYDFACLTRVFSEGFTDWSDLASILFRNIVSNYTNNTDTSFLSYKCPDISKQFPDMKHRTLQSLLQLGLSYGEVSECFNNFDEFYWQWAVKNLTEPEFQTELQVMNAILYYKDAFPGFQKLCVGKLSNSNLTGNELKTRVETLLHDFEQEQLLLSDKQNLKEKEHNSMYNYFEAEAALIDDGKNSTIFPIYRKFVDLFVSESLPVENRRYCGCSNFVRLNDFLILDFNQTQTNDSYPSITTWENIKLLSNFTRLLNSICTSGYYNYSTPQTSPNPQYSPQNSPSASYIPKSSNSPIVSKAPQSSQNPLNSPVNSPNPPSSSRGPNASPSISFIPCKSDAPHYSYEPKISNSAILSPQKTVSPRYTTQNPIASKTSTIKMSLTAMFVVIWFSLFIT